MTSNTRLLKLYRSYNKRYFHSLLPSDTQVYFDNIDGEDTEYGVCYLEDQWHIKVHPLHAVTPELIKQTLLHEMIHLYLAVLGHKNYWTHGRTFQSEILRLVRIGAYKKLL